jgi:pSer/pThr/pTyr-binding forkhead associated (FHA) protein
MASLIVTEGPDTGRHLDLEIHPTVMIGRDRDCTFQILDDRISRNHLQVGATETGKHWAIDVGSSNGTFVNDKRLEARTELTDGDVVRIGLTAMVYMTEKARITQKMEELAKRPGQRWQTTIAMDPPVKKP